jgi:hypothetical protein
MKNVDWPAAIFASLAIALAIFSTDADAGDNWVGKGTWHPTVDMGEVTVMVNWMADGVLVPCGKDKPKARACAFLPRESDIPRKGKLCEITHPGFSSSPTDRELETIGRMFEICLEQTGTRIITLRFKHGGPNIPPRPTNTYVMAMPCGISISRKISAEIKGHEIVHCWRGSWHDKV